MRSERPASRSRSGERRLYLISIALIGIALYARNLDDYFVGDDFALVGSVYDRSLGSLFELLYTTEAGDVWRGLGIDEAQGYGYLRPVKMWTFALDAAIWGANPLGYHLTVMGLFVLHGILAFLLAERLAPGHPTTAWLAAGGVVLSPAFAPLVPWVSGRDELVASAFGLAAVWVFVRFRRGGGRLWPYYLLYAAALLSKETAIVVAGLPVAFDATHGRLSLRHPARLRDALRVHAPILAVCVAYFGLRWFAFGNLAGGGGPDVPREYGSPARFLAFNLQVVDWLFGPKMFALADVAWARGVAGLAALAGLAWLVAVRRRLDRERRADLLFAGPLWYLCCAAILFGTYFSERHHVLMVVGFALFAALAVDALEGQASEAWRRAVAAALLAVFASASLPPLLATSARFEAAARTVESMRARIERETRDLPPGSVVHVKGVPQWTRAPYFFGWSLRSALSLPFTKSDLARRSRVYNRRHFQLMEIDEAWPARFDRVLDLTAPAEGG